MKLKVIRTDVLQKGDTIPGKDIALETGHRIGTADYRLQGMRVKTAVEQALRRRGLKATVCWRKDELRVLTDSEALAYNARHYRNRKRSMRRCHKRLGGLDRRLLSSEERKIHDREMDRQGRELQQLRKKDLPTLKPHRRKNPGPPRRQDTGA